MLTMPRAAQSASLTYGELEKRANQLAHRLVALGVGPEVPVGVMIPRSLELFVALLGVLKAGGAYVPMDSSYPPDRLALMMEDSEVRMQLWEVQSQRALEAGTACLLTGVCVLHAGACASEPEGDVCKGGSTDCSARTAGAPPPSAKTVHF